MDDNQMRIIAYEEGGMWVAQCLEHDISAQADTISKVKKRLLATIAAEAKDGLDRIGPAPEHFQSMWNDASGTYQPSAPHAFPDDYEMKLCA